MLVKQGPEASVAQVADFGHERFRNLSMVKRKSGKMYLGNDLVFVQEFDHDVVLHAVVGIMRCGRPYRLRDIHVLDSADVRKEGRLHPVLGTLRNLACWLCHVLVLDGC